MATTTQTQTADTGTATNADFDAPWRPQQMIEDNPIGLPDEAVETLVPKLDEIQCTMWMLYHQYQKHHWLVEGPQFMHLHETLEAHYNEVHKYIDRIAERVTALGGIPTSHPAKQSERSRIEHEPEGAYKARAMLQHDLNAERQLAQHLRETLETARDVGDPGTERHLKRALTACEERAHHLDHYLGEDSLEDGR